MIIGIHPDKTGNNESYSKRWRKYFEGISVQVNEIDLLQIDTINNLQQYDGIMWRWIHNEDHKQSAKRILYCIEKYLHIPVYPNSNTAWHYDEKISQYYLFKSLKINIPNTWLFWDQRSAIEWAKVAKFPVIAKLSVGAGSSNVIMINTIDEAFSFIHDSFTNGIFPMKINEFNNMKYYFDLLKLNKKIVGRLIDASKYLFTGHYPPLPPYLWKPEKNYVYFQEFIDGNEFDTRITIIGNRAFGYIRMNRSNDFRASGSGNFDVNPNKIDLRCVEIAFHLSQKANFQSMAYDFLIKENEPILIEISYTFTDWMVHECPGYWNNKLKWKKGNVWPQEVQAKDFYKSINK